MKTRFRPIFLALALITALGLTAPAPQAAAAERILHFKSHIVVHPDASLTVTETIKVRSAQQEIKRGIVRDFPTTYKDRFGNTVRVGFEVEEVLRNGAREPYHLKQVANGVKIYIGQKEVFLPSGVHTFTIVYRTTRQLGFFPDFDELYWNVTGHGWTFVIEDSEAVIELPPGARVLQHAAYTGRMGVKGKDYTISHDPQGNIVFTSTRAFRPGEGLTVAVAWPKGVVPPPSGQEKVGWFLRDNLGVGAGLAGLALLLGYYSLAWVRVGRDPEEGTIIPLYTPPKEFSPEAVRFLLRMGYDDKAFAAAVVNMAVKGYLTIEENDGEYTLKKTGGDSSKLSRAEAWAAGQLFLGGATLEMKSENHEYLKDARDALKKNLQKEVEKVYFNTHSTYLIPGLLLTLLVTAAIILTAVDRPQAIFAGLWLFLWTGGCYLLGVQVIRQWRGATGGRFKPGKALGALFLTVFSLFFFASWFMGVGFFAVAVSPGPAVLLAGVMSLNPLFYHLLKAPTLAGRKIMDQIEGFKLYLSVAEQERLNLLNPPERTPELFEKYLPYALALDVEVEWSEQFAEVLAQPMVDGTTYHPAWYSGDSWDCSRLSGFGDTLGSSFSGAIASASSPPGSSSGSGGGGCGGGGGGGGGGSGW